MARKRGDTERQEQIAKPAGKGFEGMMPEFMIGPKRTIEHRATEGPKRLRKKAAAVKKKPKSKKGREGVRPLI
jgi:hypothetical protein